MYVRLLNTIALRKQATSSTRRTAGLVVKCSSSPFPPSSGMRRPSRLKNPSCGRRRQEPGAHDSVNAPGRHFLGGIT